VLFETAAKYILLFFRNFSERGPVDHSDVGDNARHCCAVSIPFISNIEDKLMRCCKSLVVLTTALSFGLTVPVFAQSSGGDNAGGGSTNSMAPDKATPTDKGMDKGNMRSGAGAMGTDSGTNGNMGTEKGTGSGERPGGDAAKSDPNSMNK
jgi:hypothetical protein